MSSTSPGRALTFPIAWERTEGREGAAPHLPSDEELMARVRSDDSTGLEFRTEFFNIFNRTQFAPPNTICCNANNVNFGVITATAPGTNPRLVQFGLKFLF